MKSIIAALVAANLILSAPNRANPNILNTLTTNSNQLPNNEYKLIEAQPEPQSEPEKKSMSNAGGKFKLLTPKPGPDAKGLENGNEYVLVSPQPEEKSTLSEQQSSAKSKDDFVLLSPELEEQPKLDAFFDEDPNIADLFKEDSEFSETKSPASKYNSYKKPIKYDKPRCVPRPNVRCMQPADDKDKNVNPAPDQANEKKDTKSDNGDSTDLSKQQGPKDAGFLQIFPEEEENASEEDKSEPWISVTFSGREKGKDKSKESKPRNGRYKEVLPKENEPKELETQNSTFKEMLPKEEKENKSGGLRSEESGFKEIFPGEEGEHTSNESLKPGDQGFIGIFPGEEGESMSKGDLKPGDPGFVGIFPDEKGNKRYKKKVNPYKKGNKKQLKGKMLQSDFGSVDVSNGEMSTKNGYKRRYKGQKPS